MSDLGSIGINTAVVPSASYLAGNPVWYTPFNFVVGIKNQDSVGPLPGYAGSISGAIPASFVSSIVSAYSPVIGSVTLT